MSKPRSPLSLARRWTAGALLATTLGAGAVGVHLATDRGTTTASSAGTSTDSTGASTDSTGASTDSGSSSSSSSSTSTDSGSSSFGSVAGVASGSGSPQTSTSGS
ncbi:hypothetical protein ASD62_16355 [Phycicoccus sp. Root563]|uniref:hypothetical protein n=1 Tax=Phycicoccus sp. Root563 TaxID=1736562 RepID=UPI0007027648|nr:hypothetical protein [Phycicoccus sp. Root563]KQZ90620.1 hypothetical protein ASD62_16355 [Phycicoccus sp. Root563]